MTDKKQFFSANLSHCCTAHRSVSQVCREIAINRPQFIRYLKGDALPSASNLRKIARFFQLSEAEMFLPNEKFRSIFESRRAARMRDARSVLCDAFRGVGRKAAQLEGVYHSYYISPSWGFSIVRGVVEVQLKEGSLQTRGVLRTPMRNRRRYQKTRYYGMMTTARGHIYTVEKTASSDGALCETILQPAQNAEHNDLRGKVMAVALTASQSIFVSPMLWRPVAAGTSLRDALRDCGLFGLDNAHVPADIRAYLKAER